jgi:DedD protein
MAEPADLNLDELRRRGRRRLIGAIVLALVAAVVVPMLLESDPRPLGEDVSVRIPPVDEGKFVNKLNAPPPKAEPPKESAPATTAPAATPPPPAPAPAAESAPRKSVADAEKSVMAPPAKAPVEPRAPSKTPEPAKGAEPPKAAAPAPAPANSTAATAEPPREGFVVQLAAFSDDKGANALSGKLKRAGYPAYTETISTSRGTLWRVRVGGYPTRDAAGAARDKLKADGHAGIVLPAK